MAINPAAAGPTYMDIAIDPGPAVSADCQNNETPAIQNTGMDTSILEFMQYIQYPHLPAPITGNIAPTGGEDDIVIQADLDQAEQAAPYSARPPSPQDVRVYQNARFDSYYNWPFPAMDMDPDTATIYDKVRAAGAPNYKGARIPLTSPLRPAAWREESTGYTQDSVLLNGIEFGFPIQYTGGPYYEQTNINNHPSAEEYGSHVDEYFVK